MLTIYTESVGGFSVEWNTSHTGCLFLCPTQAASSSSSCLCAIAAGQARHHLHFCCPTKSPVALAAQDASGHQAVVAHVIEALQSSFDIAWMLLRSGSRQRGASCCSVSRWQVLRCSAAYSDLVWHAADSAASMSSMLKFVFGMYSGLPSSVVKAFAALAGPFQHLFDQHHHQLADCP